MASSTINMRRVRVKDTKTNAVSNQENNFHSYKLSLPAPERKRYEDKLGIIDGKDPYETTTWSTDAGLLPEVTYMDIVNYLLFTTSYYSQEQLKCYKGLEAYNQFVCGWVRDVGSVEVGGKIVTSAKVLHSQRMNEKPLRPWVIVEKDGRVVAGHCTCMAGLGEACTHVASLLFYMEASVKIRNSLTVTQEKAYWKLPKPFGSVTYDKLKNLDFTSATKMKRRLDAVITEDSPTAPLQKKQITTPPSDSRLTNFFAKLSQGTSRPAILSIVPEHSEQFKPNIMTGQYPLVLTELYNKDTNDMSYSEVLTLCDGVNISVTKAQAEKVEHMTKAQARSKHWQRFRAGRVTASNMGDVCHTNPASPSVSLITNICYPNRRSFSSEATTWGRSQESVALEAFMTQECGAHSDAYLTECGLIISTENPHIAATPDSLFHCSCCGVGVVEVKCPYVKKDCTPQEAAEDRSFCLRKCEDGTLQLKKNHKFFYQVQTQMAVAQVECAFFVVWTKKGIHVERILFDTDFWNNILAKANHVFRKAILPELVGKFFTRGPSSVLSDVTNKVTDKDVWCFCRDTEHGNMIGCDASDCEITMLSDTGTQAASTDPNIGVNVGVGVTGAIVLMLIVVIVVVFVKRKRKQRHTSQPSKAINADHSDISELYQNNLSPQSSAGRDHEYVSLEAKPTSTASRVAEYVNVNDSDYTVLHTAGNETNDRHPTPADVDHCDTLEFNQNSLSPPSSADRDHEYMSLEAKTMTTDNNVAEYANVNDSTYTALCLSANETKQRHPTAAGVHQNKV
ncbi:uncharacterized protein LOC106177314 [Lingula anatina]|uniref:Uncharacterized protein LOC106177314 n=1 Tax=Lingula anatina TaxID=7574 RepID=A0A1S3JYY3_LINAN|nr:uncharacterized protein LOC106177314 [Lingula anatina]|eukprot:XP_013415512.1 uncharacterized protein LOC106177314 [Lingula anatina]